jgi:hypothetical protein
VAVEGGVFAVVPAEIAVPSAPAAHALPVAEEFGGD